MDGTTAGLVGLALLLGWSGLMFGLGARLRRSGWPGPDLPDEELPWPAVVITVAGIVVLLWTAEQRVFGLPAPLLTSAPLVIVYSALLVDAGRRGGAEPRADRGMRGRRGLGMTPAQKMALVRQAWVNRQQADEAQARAEALASVVHQLARRHAPPSVIADAAEAAALAFEEAAQASHEASVAFKVIVDAMGRDGLPDDASVADWLALPSEEDQVTR